jgi:hypothetical protein
MSDEARELSGHELEVAAQREAQLRELQGAAGDMLIEINERLGIEGRDAEAVELEAHLAALTPEQLADPVLRVWWLTRLGVWVAWTLVCEQAGDWALDRDPTSQSFLRPVVGCFEGRSAGPRYDPMQVAAAALDGGEALGNLLAQISDEIAAV